jgi:hypothetical protein
MEARLHKPRDMPEGDREKPPWAPGPSGRGWPGPSGRGWPGPSGRGWMERVSKHPAWGCRPPSLRAGFRAVLLWPSRPSSVHLDPIVTGGFGNISSIGTDRYGLVALLPVCRVEPSLLSPFPVPPGRTGLVRTARCRSTSGRVVGRCRCRAGSRTRMPERVDGVCRGRPERWRPPGRTSRGRGCRQC